MNPQSVGFGQGLEPGRLTLRMTMQSPPKVGGSEPRSSWLTVVLT